MANEIIAYKGFNSDLTCLDFQYEVGQNYHHDGEVSLCGSGFHACEHPLHVLKYYDARQSRFCEVRLAGKVERGEDKLCSASIEIQAEISLGQLIERAVEFVTARANSAEGSTTRGDNCAAVNSNKSGAATASGRSGAATASGDCGAATASGRHGAATASGDCGAATASGWYGAATASGDCGAATASGEYGAATASGRSGAATAEHSTAVAHASFNGKARAVEGAAIHLDERDPDSGEILHVFAGIAGRDGVKPDTWYRLNGGKLVEV
jgi:hypothetical protein